MFWMLHNNPQEKHLHLMVYPFVVTSARRDCHFSLTMVLNYFKDMMQ